MEEAFDKLKQQGKNNVESIVQWMKDTSPKIIDGVKVTEEKAKQLFAGVDATNIELSKFKEAVTTLAAEHQKTVEELAICLAAQAPKLLEAVQAGAAALTSAIGK